MEMILFKTPTYTATLSITDSNMAAIKIQEIKDGMISNKETTIYQHAEKTINDLNDILADGRDYAVASLRDKAGQKDNITV